MSEKRYYWLKLKEGFFNQKEIKKLRRIAGGDTYTIIYLKMQLKSLESNGSLFFENFEDDFANELALEIDEEVDNIKITLLYLEKHGLIERADNDLADEFHLPAVKENTGTETATAIRVRRHRAKKLLLSNDTVTPEKLIVNGELEKEIEKDIEKEIDRKKFIKPTIAQIQEYAKEKDYTIDCEYFHDYYEKIGWVVGKARTPMKDWKAAVRNWIRNNKNYDNESKEDKILRELAI